MGEGSVVVPAGHDGDPVRSGGGPAQAAELGLGAPQSSATPGPTAHSGASGTTVSHAELAQTTTLSPPREADLEEVAARVVADAGVLARAVGSGVDGAVAAQVRGHVRAAVNLLEGASARVLAAVEADGRWAASGSVRTVAEWGARQDGSLLATNRRQAILGKALGNSS